jgi:CRP/FNR family transcriptional regulator, cyclic AMP receptor protein
MKVSLNTVFDLDEFLAHAGLGRTRITLEAGSTFFNQGCAADCVFYLQAGNAKMTVLSDTGKEATITRLFPGDFLGEESIAKGAGLRTATATAVSACTALRIETSEMLRVMHEEHAFSDLFLRFLLGRSMQTQADLVDQLFNSRERRLARILLLMAQFGMPGEPLRLIPPITEEALAEMVGTAQAQVSLCLGRFHKLGFIDYDDRIHVNASLLNVLLHDQSSEQNAVSASLFGTAFARPASAERGSYC